MNELNRAIDVSKPLTTLGQIRVFNKDLSGQAETGRKSRIRYSQLLLCDSLWPGHEPTKIQKRRHVIIVRGQIDPLACTAFTFRHGSCLFRHH